MELTGEYEYFEYNNNEYYEQNNDMKPCPMCRACVNKFLIYLGPIGDAHQVMYCPICMLDTYDVAIFFCGHAVCNNCFINLGGSTLNCMITKVKYPTVGAIIKKTKHARSEPIKSFPVSIPPNPLMSKWKKSYADAVSSGDTRIISQISLFTPEDFPELR